MTALVRLRRYTPFATASLQGLLHYRSTFVISAVTATTAAAVQVFLGGPCTRAADRAAPRLRPAPTDHVRAFGPVLGLMQPAVWTRRSPGGAARDIAMSLLRPFNYR